MYADCASYATTINPSNGQTVTDILRGARPKCVLEIGILENIECSGWAVSIEFFATPPGEEAHPGRRGAATTGLPEGPLLPGDSVSSYVVARCPSRQDGRPSP
jgi:hypothetical protein